MAVILDHLTAIIVASSLLGVLLFVQQRGHQRAAENTIHHNAQVQAFSIMETLERDIENMRDEHLTDEPQCVQHDGTNTTFLRFHTLADPSLGETSPILAVSYELEDAGWEVPVNGVLTPVYRLARYVRDGSGSGYVLDGGSTETLTGFQASLISEDGSTVQTDGCGIDQMGRVRVELTAAQMSVSRLASDQNATSRSNQTQQAFTVRPAGLYIADDTPLPPGTIIPPLDPDIPYPPPPEPDPDPDPDPDPPPPEPDPDPDPDPDPPPPEPDPDPDPEEDEEEEEEEEDEWEL